MAEFGFTLKHPALGVLYLPYEVQDDFLSGLLAHATESYGAQVQDGEGKDGKPVMRDRSPRELLRLYADGLVQGTLNNVHGTLDRLAAAQKPPVPQFEATPGEVQITPPAP